MSLALGIAGIESECCSFMGIVDTIVWVYSNVDPWRILGWIAVVFTIVAILFVLIMAASGRIRLTEISIP